MEILTGVERRRDWSDDEKLSILQEAANPDARIADVARRHDIKPSRFRPSDGSLLRIRLGQWFLSCRSHSSRRHRATRLSVRHPWTKPTTKRSARPTRIEIGCKGGRVLKVEANIEPDVLKALICSVEDA
ncbi:transposase [Shinella sedimenti]|uniref:transposase n=1 Tax=Shinella sedimenti TaxID=2919913 RepID=UPI0035203C46